MIYETVKGDTRTIRYLSTGQSPEKPWKMAGRNGNQGKRRNHPDNSIITEKSWNSTSAVGFRRLAVS